MSNLKRLSLLLLCLIFCFSFTSCKTEFLKQHKFKTIDFSEAQKIQLVTSDEIYNILLLKSENGCVNINFVDEAPKTLLDMSIKITNDFCEIQSDDISFSTSINNFSNNFLPVIIYKFLMETDFTNEQFEFKCDENLYVIEKTVLGKTVVFKVQLSLDELSQCYILEIK